MLGKIVTGSANQNQEAKKAQEAKPASDLDGSTPSNQPPLVNILLLYHYTVHVRADLHTKDFCLKSCQNIFSRGSGTQILGVLLPLAIFLNKTPRHLMLLHRILDLV